MKAKIIIYWIVTVLLSALMLVNAAAYVSSEPHGVAAFRLLGYPDYFRFLLGILKILGAIALLTPGMKIVKEWAYAGFGITFIAAVVSHLSVGQHTEAIAPVVSFGLLAASYLLRPVERRVVEAPAL